MFREKKNKKVLNVIIYNLYIRFLILFKDILFLDIDIDIS